MRRMTPARPGRGGIAAGFFYIAAPSLANAGGLALAPLLALCGIVGAPWRGGLAMAARNLAVVVPLIAFAAWAAASTLWSAQGGLQGARFFFGIITGLMFVAAANEHNASRRLARAAALAGAVILAGVGLVEAFHGMWFNRMGQPDAEIGALMRNPGRGVSFLVIVFAAGLGGWLSGGWVTRFAALIAGAAIARLGFAFEMDVNIGACALALAAFIAGFLAPRLMMLALTWGLALWVLAAPWIMPALIARIEARFPDLPDSWAIRLEIWKFVSARIAEAPLIGGGLDSARGFAGQTAITNGIEHQVVPLHPHNVALHIWLETGAVGAVLAALALIGGGWAMARALAGARTIAASACAAITAIALFWNVSYGAWQEWMVAAAFAAAALVGASRRSVSDPAP